MKLRFIEIKKNQIKKGSYTLFVGIAIIAGLLFLKQIKDDLEQENFVEQEKLSPVVISPEEAQAIACNYLRETSTGVELSHPNHFVQFDIQGVSFQPKKGPEWKWKLDHIGTYEKPLKEIPIHSVKPESYRPRIIEYRYGDIIEEYHAKLSTVEQRFVLETPLNLEGQDLVVRGSVESLGQFKELEEGWAWADDQGRVFLGDVTVFDAQGKTLMAHMNVTAHQTEIVVDAQSLAQATYPVTIDPEIGANDFRISDMGLFDGEPIYDAFRPAIAYNSTSNEYLVVWHGDDDTVSLLDEEFEIYGQRIDASTGQEVGVNDFRISDMGIDGEFLLDAFNPDVVYNLKEDEYLVVWEGSNDLLPNFTNGEFEIYGQRIDASTGQEIGVNDFRISNMGPNGDQLFDAFKPSVAYNSTDNEYLVVWEGDSDSGVLVNEEFEIYGQRIDASTGQEIGVNDFRISDMGFDGDLFFGALNPAVAYNLTDNEYLVVWEGDDGAGSLVNDEFEIYGQRIDASTGQEVGVNDFRISDMGSDGDPAFIAVSPEVAYNPTDDEYLVVWEGDNDIGVLVNEEFEIYGQRINASTGQEVGVNDFRISDMGPDGNSAFIAISPEVVYNPTDGEYLVVWTGVNGTQFSIDGETEIFGQRIDASTGLEVGVNDIRFSDVSVVRVTSDSVVAYSSISNEYLIVWNGGDDTFPLQDDPFEIYGQRYNTDTLGSDVSTLSLASGGTQNLLLDFGPDFAGRNFLVLGSLAGTTPGTTLGSGKIIPLNIDAYFLLTLNNPNEPSSTLPNGFGVLDANGQATVQFVLPPGLTLPLGINEVNHAAIIVDVQPNLLKISEVSNAEPCKLE